jgi:anti-anti-sigma regulatory factor
LVAGTGQFTAEVGRHLGYHDLDILADELRDNRQRLSVVVDMADTEDATTAGLARLVVLRRMLIRTGGDLRLAHLHGQPMRIYNVNRLAEILPCEQEQHERQSAAAGTK